MPDRPLGHFWVFRSIALVNDRDFGTLGLADALAEESTVSIHAKSGAPIISGHCFDRLSRLRFFGHRYTRSPIGAVGDEWCSKICVSRAQWWTLKDVAARLDKGKCIMPDGQEFGRVVVRRPRGVKATGGTILDKPM